MTAIRDMLTEEEAMKKWCPYTKPYNNEIPGQEFDETRCLASNCMFWRWSHQVTNDLPSGFCGAAGLPKYL